MKGIYKMLEKMLKRFNVYADGEKIFNIISNKIKDFKETGVYNIPIIGDFSASIKLTEVTNASWEYEIVSISNNEKTVLSQEVF